MPRIAHYYDLPILIILALLLAHLCLVFTDQIFFTNRVRNMTSMRNNKVGDLVGMGESDEMEERQERKERRRMG